MSNPTEPHATQWSIAVKHCWVQQSQGLLCLFLLLPVPRQQASSWLRIVASRKGSERALLKFALSIDVWEALWDPRLKQISGRWHKPSHFSSKREEEEKGAICLVWGDKVLLQRGAMSHLPFLFTLDPGKHSLIRQLTCPRETMHKRAN